MYERFIRFYEKYWNLLFLHEIFKKNYGITESDLLENNFYKKFISSNIDFLQTIRNF